MDPVTWTIDPPPPPPGWWSEIPQRARDRVLRGFGQYLHKLVVHVKANKLKGQVLKYRTGKLYRTFGAQLDMGDASARIFETAYGALWENTGHDGIKPKAGCQCPICRRSPEKWLHFKSPEYGWVRKREIRPVPAKPHVKPGIEEMRETFVKLVLEPLTSAWASWMKGRSA